MTNLATNKIIKMYKFSIVSLVFLMSVMAFGQKKKDLLNEIAQLKSQTSAMQEQLNNFKEAKKLNLKDSLQNFSYAFGVSIGNNLKTIGFDTIAYNAFVLALEDGIHGKEKIAVREAQGIVQTTVRKLQEKEAKIKSEKGIQFLTKNGKRPEVVTTTSGLQYEIVKKGTGAIPKISDRIKIHYTGMLIDGKVFDSSVEKGVPAVFKVNEVVKGWQEALQLMPVGSKWIVYIPYQIAYGPNGRPPIPPYATLIFEMELLDIVTN